MSIAKGQTETSIIEQPAATTAHGETSAPSLGELNRRRVAEILSRSSAETPPAGSVLIVKPIDEEPVRPPAPPPAAPAPVPTRRLGEARWIGRGERVEVKGVTIQDGLFYLGERLSQDEWREENCLVKASLDVARSGRAAPWEMAYSHYSRATPGARRAFLEWLASGRTDPGAHPNLVLLYFHGLEYRLFREAPGEEEAAALIAEGARLLACYGQHDMISRPLSAFLETSRLAHGELSPPVLSLEREGYGYDIPPEVRIHLGRKLDARLALDADDGLLWLASLPGMQFRTPARRCADAFKALWQIRFAQAYPKGLKVSPPKARIAFTYRAASGTFEVPVRGPHEALPDIAALSAPITKLRALADACSDELDGFSRLLGRQPEAGRSAQALLLLPEPLRLPALQERFRDALGENLDHLLSDGRTQTISCSDLAELLDLPLTPTGKAGAAFSQQAAQVLDAFDLGFEPDRRYGGQALVAETRITLFRAPQGAPVDPQRAPYQDMRARIEVAVLAAAADGEITDGEFATIQASIMARPDLNEAERARLCAIAAGLRHDRPKQQAVLKRLQALARPERAAVAQGALSAAMSDGLLSAAEMKFIERLYNALGLPAEEAYQAIHRFSPEATPAPSTQVDTTAPLIFDQARLDRLRAETHAVSQLLSDIFVEDEPVRTAPPSTRSAVTPQSPYAGLDAAHAALLGHLDAADGGLPREAFDIAAREHGLLPDGAIEAINDWAYDYFEEPLLEAEDEVNIPAHLSSRLRELREPRP